ncbi:Vacuolar protein sorting-associated protein 52 A [Galdieria sulphuraria]|nr:Vacuolar protein sorting-associated protein 52 A [Galdieria sulphuraria]
MDQTEQMETLPQVPFFTQEDWEAIEGLLVQSPTAESLSSVEDRKGEFNGKDIPASSVTVTAPNTVNSLLETIKSGNGVSDAFEVVQNCLREAESSCVEEYVSEGNKVVKLRDQVLQCDTDLNEIEQKITYWSSRLALLSRTTQEYYEEAILMNERLLREKQSHGTILQFLENATLSSELVSGIIELDPSNKQFVQYLIELQEKVYFLSKPETRECAVIKDIQPFTQKMISRASEKVKDHLQSKIQMLQSPNTNVQIIQQNVLLKQKEFFRFLRQCSPKIYKEIENSYVSVISGIYQSLFRKYTDGLLALKQEVNLKGENLIDGSWFGPNFGGSFVSTSSTGAFVLGNRIESLRKLEEPAVVLAIAKERRRRLFIEEIFRCLIKLLVDTCTSEFLFALETFGPESDMLVFQILRDVFALCFGTFERQLTSTFDLFGCLLIMKQNELFRNVMATREISLMDDFFVKMDILVKPRFQELIQQSIQNVAQASSKPLFPGQEDVSPLALTRRYVEYASGLIQVMVEMSTSDKMLEENIKRLRMEYVSLLNRIGNHYSRKKSRSLFVVNNLDLICLVLEERKLEHTEEYSFYESILSKQISTIVELELEEHFSDFMVLFNRYSKDHSIMDNNVWNTFETIHWIIFRTLKEERIYRRKA